MNYVSVYASAREGWVTTDPFQALEYGENGGNGREAQRRRCWTVVLWTIQNRRCGRLLRFTDPEISKGKERSLREQV
jgi:hypothetical protein